MAFQKFSLQSSSLGFFFMGFILLFLFLVSGWDFLGGFFQSGGYFLDIPDFISVYFSFLSILLWIAIFPLFTKVSSISRFLVSFSLVFSLLSYSTNHALVFWGCYELSILPLLLLILSESPYSERYLAAWYFLVYILLSGLPLLLCFLYAWGVSGTFMFSAWYSWVCVSGVMVLVSVFFITKIPLFPFHVWLPIVHAEASSIVSVCLSGYIMKLGVLGLCRFCFCVLPLDVLCDSHMWVCLVVSVLFFFSASRELDGKRWLAFLSLAHICVAALCLNCGSGLGNVVGYSYCLGHGLSAGLVFILLWLFYDVFGTRNWLILKGVSGGANFLSLLFILGICSAASIPPTLQFFSELFIVGQSTTVSLIFTMGLVFYLFLGGLVPLLLIGCSMTRHSTLEVSGGLVPLFFSSLCFLVACVYLLFLF